jgi:tRNA 2-thiocytidine biosynthesis protein TtcA
LCSDRSRLSNQAARATIDAGFKSIGYSIRRHALLEKHTTILVGISGGIDSLVLLFLLLKYNETYRQRWDIKAVHIDAGFPGWDPVPLEKYLAAYKIQTIVVKTNGYKSIRKTDDKCFLCSRQRRKKIMEVAEELDFFNIALAHHQEDVVETLLLNMLYSGRISTFLPRQPIILSRFVFVRPLYYLDKKTILEIGRALGLKRFPNVCPFYKDSRRERIRELLNIIRNRNPDVYANIFHSIFNINKKYMPAC